MPRDKVLIFDADGVVFNSKPYFKHLADTGVLTQEDVAEFFGFKFHECIVGKYSIEKLMTDFFKNKNLQLDVSEVLQDWFAYENQINQKLITTIQSLSNTNVILLATNQESLRASYIQNSEIKEYFDLMYFSCRLGIDKSSPDFFYKIVSENGYNLKNCHFWDDSDAPLESARLAGICSHKFTDVDSFNDDLESIR